MCSIHFDIAATSPSTVTVEFWVHTLRTTLCERMTFTLIPVSLVAVKVLALIMNHRVRKSRSSVHYSQVCVCFLKSNESDLLTLNILPIPLIVTNHLSELSFAWLSGLELSII